MRLNPAPDSRHPASQPRPREGPRAHTGQNGLSWASRCFLGAPEATQREWPTRQLHTSSHYTQCAANWIPEGWGHRGGGQAPHPGSPAWVLHMGVLGRNSSEQGPLWLCDTPTPFCGGNTPSPPQEAHGLWDSLTV